MPTSSEYSLAWWEIHLGKRTTMGLPWKLEAAEVCTSVSGRKESEESPIWCFRGQSSSSTSTDFQTKTPGNFLIDSTARSVAAVDRSTDLVGTPWTSHRR